MALPQSTTQLIEMQIVKIICGRVSGDGGVVAVVEYVESVVGPALLFWVVAVVEEEGMVVEIMVVVEEAEVEAWRSHQHNEDRLPAPASRLMWPLRVGGSVIY